MDVIIHKWLLKIQDCMLWKTSGGFQVPEVIPWPSEFRSAFPLWASLVAQRLKRLPPMRETQVRSLGREDPLEKEMVTTPVFLPGESRGQRSLVGYSPGGLRVGNDWATSLSTCKMKELKRATFLSWVSSSVKWRQVIVESFKQLGIM